MLTTMAIHALPNAMIQIGPLQVPAFMAADIAARIAQAVGDTEAEDRRVCREHVDRMFDAATIQRVRYIQDRSYCRLPVVIVDANHARVRLGALTTAWLLRDGDYARGFAAGWRLDPVFGPVSELLGAFVRVSVKWPQNRRIEE